LGLAGGNRGLQFGRQGHMIEGGPGLQPPAALEEQVLGDAPQIAVGLADGCPER
jgi:hypothetical protein